MSDNNFSIRMILIVLAVVILVVLITQYSKRKVVAVQEESTSIPRFENFTEPSKASGAQSLPSSSDTPKPVQQSSTNNIVKASEQLENEDYKAVDFEVENKMPNDCFPKDKLTVDDLLPKDAANSTWAQVNPAGQGDVKDQNFLNAGFHIGVNTIGQSLRNPNYQLRSDPPNPKLQVSPWNQTTIEYDASRRFFEVGEC